MSGIKARTIRIWEQLYSFLKPSRTGTNIRFYSNEELKKILNVALLNKYGFKISHIDRMNEGEMKEKILSLNQLEAQQERMVNTLIQNMVDLNMESFEEILDNFISARGVERNQLDSAEQIVNRILRLGGNNTGDIYFLKGIIEMEKGNFENAAKIFKTALNTSFTDPKLSRTIIDDIKRCGVGESFTKVPEQVFLEQLGTEVNTIWDEINPIYSINTDSKFYFNSNRENPGATSNTGLDFELPFDMYSTSLSKGEWSEINALNPDLNTNTHDLLIDFNENGQVVIFKSGPKLNELIFKTDTLSQSNTVRTGKLEIPFIQPGDELFFFTDTFLLFSSKRPGGLGGYDLYYSSRRDSEWSVPKNPASPIGAAKRAAASRRATSATFANAGDRFINLRLSSTPTA